MLPRNAACIYIRQPAPLGLGHAVLCAKPAVGDSPFFVHMVAGLGTGLFLFDRNGAAQNPIDDNANRYGSDGRAPSSYFNPSEVYYDLDRVVDSTGVSNGSKLRKLLRLTVPTSDPSISPVTVVPHQLPVATSVTAPAASPFVPLFFRTEWT